MKSQFGTVRLSDGTTEASQGFEYDGQQINDRADFLRAAGPTWFPRSRARQVRFSVLRSQTSLHLSERLVLEHFEALPTSADLSLYLGTDADGEWVVFAGAVLDGMRATYVGLSPAFEYTFSVGAPSFSQPAPSYTEPTADMIKRGKTALTNGAVSQIIPYGATFASIPVVTVGAIAGPAGGDYLSVRLVDGSETTTQFEVEFNAPIPSANYKLPWTAVV